MGKRRTVVPPHPVGNDDSPRVVGALIGRREFVLSAGGLFVATAMGCSSGTDSGSKGTIRVTISGLAPTAPNAGTVTATPSKGGEPTTFQIPTDGTSTASHEVEVVADTYAITYQAPPNHVLAPGTTIPSSVEIRPLGLKIIEVQLSVVPQVGTIQVSVSGIAAGAANGGSASIAPAAGGTPVILDVGVNGSASGQFAPGSYNVTYTPPAGHNITAGANPQNVSVTANQTVTATYTVAQQTGTLQITVTGITGSPANGGSAAVTPTGGGATVTVNVNTNGSGTGTFAPGSYSVTYTPPNGNTISSGANPQTVNITAGQTATATWTVTATVGFQTPDIKNNASFETDFDGFTNWSSGTPTGVVRDTTRAFVGTTAIKKGLPATSGSDIGSQFVYACQPGFDRLWGRFYFYLDNQINGTHKLNLWFDLPFNNQFGGLYLEGGNLSAFAEDTANSGFARLMSLSTLVGGWHSLEVDYWRNGDTSKGGVDLPSMAIYLDGTQITSGFSIPSPMSFVNGRLNFGARTKTAKLGIYELLGLLNGAPANTVAGNIWVDKVAISSVGRIGP